MLQQIPPGMPKRLSFDRKAAEAVIWDAIKAGKHFLNEVESKKLLFSYGICVNPTELAADASGAAEISERMGYPVAVKICSAEIVHKKTAGCVVLNAGNEDEVLRAFSHVTENARLHHGDAEINGVTVQPMLERPDYEMILGVKKDKDFGPVLLFGTGGIFTEVIRDRALALPPLNRLLARRLMEETAIYQVLKGYRNYPAADITQLEEMLMRLSQLAADFSEIAAIDINPVLFSGQTAVAADARVILEPSETQAPKHLVISPYPNQYEEHVDIQYAGRLLIRPIRPEDAPLLTEFFKCLSMQSIYYRFFNPIKKIPQSMLVRFTQIDYDREICLVAMRESSDEERMLGVARIILEKNLKNAEFAIIVEDQWQGRGIGAELMKRCLSIARERKVERVWGMVLQENTNMLALGRKLGFTMKKMYGEGNAVELTLDLKGLGRDAGLAV